MHSSIQPCWFIFTSEMYWPLTYLTPLPHMPALFMTTLILTAGHKMVPHSHVFITFKHILNKQENKSCKENILKPAVFLLLFHSYQHGL